MQRTDSAPCATGGRPYAHRMVKTATWRHGADLRRFREDRLKISQQAAATKVGVSLGAYSAWERGTAIPKLESLADLVEHLGAPPEVVGYEPPSGWELVPADWIRAHFEAADERAKQRHQEVMTALGGLDLSGRAVFTAVDDVLRAVVAGTDGAENS